MKKKNSENYLDKKPARCENISWSVSEEQKVTLEIENKGVFNKLAQLILKKPKISYIHLEDFGSFIWTILDGEKTIFELGKEVKSKFGEEAKPLYERLIKYFQILDSYGFITWN